MAKSGELSGKKITVLSTMGPEETVTHPLTLALGEAGAEVLTSDFSLSSVKDMQGMCREVTDDHKPHGVVFLNPGIKDARNNAMCQGVARQLSGKVVSMVAVDECPHDYEQMHTLRKKGVTCFGMVGRDKTPPAHSAVIAAIANPPLLGGANATAVYRA